MGLTEQTSYTGSKADLIDTVRQIERGYKKAEQKAVAARIRRIIENWTHIEPDEYEPAHVPGTGIGQLAGTWHGGEAAPDGGGGSGD